MTQKTLFSKVPGDQGSGAYRHFPSNFEGKFCMATYPIAYNLSQSPHNALKSFKNPDSTPAYPSLSKPSNWKLFPICPQTPVPDPLTSLQTLNGGSPVPSFLKPFSQKPIYSPLKPTLLAFQGSTEGVPSCQKGDPKP